MTGSSDVKRVLIVAAAIAVPAAVILIVAWRQAGEVKEFYDELYRTQYKETE